MRQSRELVTRNETFGESQDQMVPRAITIRSLGRCDCADITVDHRRNLAYLVSAKGEHFRVIVMTDDVQVAQHLAYDLAGW